MAIPYVHMHLSRSVYYSTPLNINLVQTRIERKYYTSLYTVERCYIHKLSQDIQYRASESFIHFLDQLFYTISSVAISFQIRRVLIIIGLWYSHTKNKIKIERLKEMASLSQEIICNDIFVMDLIHFFELFKLHIYHLSYHSQIV